MPISLRRNFREMAEQQYEPKIVSPVREKGSGAIGDDYVGNRVGYSAECGQIDAYGNIVTDSDSYPVNESDHPTAGFSDSVLTGATHHNTANTASNTDKSGLVIAATGGSTGLGRAVHGEQK